MNQGKAVKRGFWYACAVLAAISSLATGSLAADTGIAGAKIDAATLSERAPASRGERDPADTGGRQDSVGSGATLLALFDDSGSAKAGSPSRAAGFFGTVAFPFSRIGSRSDWNRVRDVDMESFRPDCDSSDCRERYRALERAAQSGKPFAQTLRDVNQAVNTLIEYVSDQKNYRMIDHWAAGSETIARGRGDCEDFAILKHALLRRAGIPENSMSLIVLKDNARRLYHAVLAVSTNKGHLILDNATSRVYMDTDVPQYQPLFSFSADRSWIHGLPAGNRYRTAGARENLGSIAPGEGTAMDLEITAMPSRRGEGLKPARLF